MIHLLIEWVIHVLFVDLYRPEGYTHGVGADSPWKGRRKQTVGALKSKNHDLTSAKIHNIVGIVVKRSRIRIMDVGIWGGSGDLWGRGSRRDRS